MNIQDWWYHFDFMAHCSGSERQSSPTEMVMDLHGHPGA